MSETNKGGSNTPKAGEQGFQKSTVGKDINVPTVSSFLSNKKKPYGNLEESVEDQKTYADIISPKKKHQVRAQMKARKIIDEQIKVQGSNSIILSFGSVQEQLDLFDNWAKIDSQVPDLYSPDKDYRYDLIEPILNSEHDDLDYDSARALRRLGYEHYYAKSLPVFVVGSKDLAKPRLACLSGSVREVDTQAFLEGASVLDSQLPGALEYDCEGSRVEGTLIWIKTDQIGRNSRQSLDTLHGFDKDHPWDSKYIRTVEEVDNGRFTRPAWVYMLKL